jgi:formylglycine-generating enzyme required for sulfatase activity
MTSSSLDKPQLGDYLLHEVVEENAFTTVYLATKTSQSQKVFLQTINASISNNENFIVRFELLKNTYQQLKLSKLVPIIDIDCINNIYYLVKKYPLNSNFQRSTLKDFLTSKNLTSTEEIEDIVEQIAHGLSQLEDSKLPFFPEGIIADTLDLEHIFFYYNEDEKKLHISLDGYLESFLFYGDSPCDTLRYFFEQTFYQWKQQNKSSSPYKNQNLYPPYLRTNQPANKFHNIYTLGSIIRHILSYSHSSKDNSPYLPPLSSYLEETSIKCLAPKESNPISSCKEILTSIRKKRQKSLNSTFYKKKETSPRGMSLISFEEKVLLGSNNGLENEQPLFKGHIKPFYIDQAPITCLQMEAFLPNYKRHPLSNGDSHPAIGISWQIAQDFCKWRNTQENLPPNTYRLPTEYEWEAAARGSEGKQFPWEEKEYPLHIDQALEKGAKSVYDGQPGRFNLYHMLGNTWEWTSSNYKPHPLSKQPPSKFNNKMKVVKGGCWTTSAKLIKSSLRQAFFPIEPHPFTGFRCARSYDK